ncbi:ABC transporter permease [Plantibacter sp. YIM 135347]|uniref:ABC transporter permease n=1 Tax=Plantibacter sp. YIM 135347 TaxID=3423919 RepID=UPI003D3260EF
MSADVGRAARPETGIEAAVPGGGAGSDPRPPIPAKPRQSLLARVARHPSTVPVAAVVLALLIGAGIIAAAGYSPITAYSAILTGALDPGNVDYTISTWGYILGMALAAAIPLRMGEFNLGGNGQLALGGIVAAVVAGQPGLPGPLAVVAALVAAIVIGALFSAIAAPLATRFGVPVIISTLMLAPVGVAIASFLVRYPLADPGSPVAQTPAVPAGAQLLPLGDLRYTNVGLLILIAALVVFWLVDTRTSVGFELRVAGVNRTFAAYGGLRAGRLTLGSMAFAGAAAGLVGAVIVLSPPYRFIDGALISPGYTTAGMAAAFLAGGRPSLLPVTVALFTILQVGGPAMQRDAGIPGQLSEVIQGVVIIVLALRTVIARVQAGRRES